MTHARAYAKLNLALVVGPLRADGKHEVATVMQAIDLYDELELEPADALAVDGFEEDTLVRAALVTLAERAGVEPGWRVQIDKRIPVAAGLGGGSSNAATALRLANAELAAPVSDGALHDLAADLGADVPFFLEGGPRLATGDGSQLAPLELPADYVALVVLPSDEQKASTASVYRAFDARSGPEGYGKRRDELLQALGNLDGVRDLAALPPNDLASSPLSDELARLGAFRADVTGAGPAVYGLFEEEPAARRAATSLRRVGPTWLARPVAGAGSPAR
jgi:4-diphosphocytidyl-2-C-methyl-D-erythritol kinase